MVDEKLIEKIIREVLKDMGEGRSSGRAETGSGRPGLDPARDYPLAAKRPEMIKTPGGKSLAEITLERVLSGEISADEFRITPEALHLQAEIAEKVGRVQFAGNLHRAAELTSVPDERILEIYNALRPYRSTRQELESIALELEEKYGARINAAFIREAAGAYERRSRLRA
ncbi:MAG: diol dehydratase small subunit [Desulfocucumaceae bacterium]